MTATPPAPSLADLRQEIDRIDEAMHRLLMERGTIIDRLIAVKKTSKAGRLRLPARPRGLDDAGARRASRGPPAARHGGGHLAGDHRAPSPMSRRSYSVHADISGGDAPMRDSARFHFGFTVPYVTHPSAAAVIEAVAASRGDLGIFRLDQGAPAAPGGARSPTSAARRSSRACPSSSGPTIRPAPRSS